MNSQRLRSVSLSAIAVLTAGCATGSPLSAPRSDLGQVSATASNTSVPQPVWLCKFGPAGTSATFNITATGGVLPLGTTTTLAATDNSDGCVVIWRSVEPQPNPDVIHTVTVTEVGQTGGTVLSAVVTESMLDGATYEVPPVNSATVRVNYANGATIWFKNVAGPDDGGAAGCTPGFWRQTHHYPYWTGYAPSAAFSSVFANAFPGQTLGQVVMLGGGGLNALGRHTVAALLNAASPEVDYGMTTGQVIAAFNAAYASGSYEAQKDVFEGFNERGCSVDKGENSETSGEDSGPPPGKGPPSRR